jgi:hypothetical protein
METAEQMSDLARLHVFVWCEGDKTYAPASVARRVSVPGSGARRSYEAGPLVNNPPRPLRGAAHYGRSPTPTGPGLGRWTFNRECLLERHPRQAQEGRCPGRTLLSGPSARGRSDEAVKRWVYTPTLLNGVPTPIIMTVRVYFRLNGPTA